MDKFVLSEHAKTVLSERGIKEKWLNETVFNPDEYFDKDDGTRHYIKVIPEYGSRKIRVVVNVGKQPPVIITAFFDRRLNKN